MLEMVATTLPSKHLASAHPGRRSCGCLSYGRLFPFLDHSDPLTLVCQSAARTRGFLERRSLNGCPATSENTRKFWCSRWVFVLLSMLRFDSWTGLANSDKMRRKSPLFLALIKQRCKTLKRSRGLTCEMYPGGTWMGGMEPLGDIMGTSAGPGRKKRGGV